MNGPLPLEERGKQSRVPGENPFWPAFKSVSCCIIINNCLLRLGKKNDHSLTKYLLDEVKIVCSSTNYLLDELKIVCSLTNYLLDEVCSLTNYLLDEVKIDCSLTTICYMR